MAGFGGQVQPPLTEKELNKMFLNTLKVPYYDWMIGNSNKDFSDVVSIEEMIEAEVKQGKIEIIKAKKLIPKRKEGEPHAVSYQGKAYNPSYPPQQNYGYQLYNQYGGNVAQENYQSNSVPMAIFFVLPPPTQVVTTQSMGLSGNNAKNSREARPQRERPQFNPILMTYTELYPKLIQCGLLEPISIPLIRPPYPRWYKKNASCDYHSGNRGHSLEDCTALKWRVREDRKSVV